MGMFGRYDRLAIVVIVAAMAALAACATTADTPAEQTTNRMHLYLGDPRHKAPENDIPVVYPLAGVPQIRSDYGSLRTPAGYRRKTGRHGGVDIVAPYGSDVIAAAPGWASNASNKRGGKGVRIVHSVPYYRDVVTDGGTITFPLRLSTAYYHLSEITKSGGWIERGEIIGKLGRTGAYSGSVPHLHFEVTTSNGTLNPHLLWADGPGKITCFYPDRNYPKDKLVLTYPLTC